MSEFDDPGFRDQLQRLGGHYADDEIAYATVLQKVRVAKRRRGAAVFGGLGAACLFAVGAFAVTSNDSHRLSPADSGVEQNQAISETTGVQRPEPTTTTESSEPAPTEKIETTATTTPPTSAVEPISPTPSDTPSSNTSSSNQGSGSKGTGSKGTGSKGTGSVSSSPPSSSAPDFTPSSSTPVSTTEVRTFVSRGGSITVRLQDNQLSLLGTKANAGYQLELDKNEPSRIRVKFVIDSHESSIDVTISDGHLSHDVNENGGASSDTGSTVAGDRPDPTTSYTGSGRSDQSPGDGSGHSG